MLIKVLGPGCAKCKEVEKVINVVVQESGSSAKVEKVTDFKEMMALGVMSVSYTHLDVYKRQGSGFGRARRRRAG